MTLQPDDDRPLGHSHDGPVQTEGVQATTERNSPADGPEGIDEEPELQAHRTDVEDSPTGHS